MAKKTPEQIADEEERTSSLGLLRYAHEYQRAAEMVKQQDDRSVVPYMLIAHSLELGLKAFLRSRGATLDALLELRHGLPRIHERAMGKRLDRLWPSAAELLPTLELLEAANHRQALRYIVNGTKTYPDWNVVNLYAQGMIVALTEHCLRDKFGGKAGAAEVKKNRGPRNVFPKPVPRKT
ncbi:hypothetical protein [Stenotrophomonas sp. JAI102]|uniref:hypothetical protein n=1 Tax=Stenotrophomonas sp. JAI102 TaxID=2723077 RepID=UPI0015CA5221|nr:hypothetical protein [Stenotrophomonas sp. JAI102]NYF35856.1 hypothetical protein [Stenotrophomonas sp. JAI102]